MKSLLERRDFRLLLVGQGVSALGDWLGTIAFMVLVHALTESSAAVGGVLVLRLLPAAFAGPLVARAVRRWDRRHTMLVMDATRAAMIAVVPLVRGLWWIYLWAFMIEVASLVFLPARDASIPDLAGERDLELANGLVLGSSYGTIPLGAGAFALVAALPGQEVLGRPFAIAFWADAVTYLVSFVLVSRIAGLGGTPAGTPEGAAAPAPPGTPLPGADVSTLRFGAAFRIPLVRAVMPAAATAAMGLGSLFSLGVVFVQEVLEATDAEFGVLIAMFGVGAALGLALLRLLESSLATVRLLVMAQGAVIAGMSLAPGVGLTFLGAAGFGAATAATLAAGMSLLQAQLAGPQRVLAFAAFHVVIRAGLSLAAIVAGVAADLVGAVRWPVVGTLPSVRVVLFCSGVVVMASAGLVYEAGSRVRSAGAEEAA